MKRSLIFFMSTLLCSSVTMAGPLHNDQQATDRQIRAERPSFLGVELGEVNRETVTRLKLREERGALIEGVTSGSSAAQAGLQKNDVILKWDGEPIESAREMSRHIRETPPGRVVRLTVMRDGREMEISVTLGERSSIATPTRPRIARPAVASMRVRPDVQINRLRNRSHLGVELQSMTPQLAEYFGLSKRSGALVIFVFADSPAAKAGLKAGDVILSAGGETVDNPLDVRRVLSGKTEGTIEFKILRDKQERTLSIQLEKGSNSWLLVPDDPWDAIHAEISPLSIQVPMVAISPTSIHLPAVSVKAMTIQVPTVQVSPMAIPVKPMTIQVPTVQVSPMAIPSVKLAPMKLEIPKIQIEPMKIDPLIIEQIKIDPIKIDPAKIVVVPRRIVL
jgi:serine protease Do